ncbi:MAG: hypothetical protein H0V00_15305 [Chloroflexia bacterium]|nr:hypothetical protein [Chloroflexia bacterium]
MTFVVIAKPPSREFYEQVQSVLDLKGNPPPGLLVHTASESEDGVQVVGVWESREAAEEFERTRLFPAMESSGATGQGRPSVQQLEPFNEWIRGI